MRIEATRAREVGAWVMLNVLWTPLSLQDAALLTIAVPAAVLRLAPESHVLVLSILTSISAGAAMIVPPFAGWLSDTARRTGTSRRLFVALGLAIDIVALIGLSFAHTLVAFAALLVLATCGANIAIAAYQALLPESVPRRHWGAVSGVRGVVTLLGTVLGFAIAGAMPDPRYTFLATAIIIALGGLSLLAIGDGVYDNEDHAKVRDWHDFLVVFAARTLVFFGLGLLQTFVFFFFRDVQKISDPSAGTALYAFSTMIGAVASSVYLGILSDRAPRKIVTAIAGAPMALAAIGFALAPELRWMLPFAVLFGIGFGGVLSSGWALAMDTIPELGDVARDLGLWGIATNLPSVVAPLIGGWLIGLFHGGRAGYQAVFGLAGFSFVLASLSVLRVGRSPQSSMWAIPARWAAITSNFVWNHIRYRVRSFGKLPRRRGATLIVANHQHDLESMAIMGTIYIQSGPWRHPIFTACSRRMYEPGFMAYRIPWARDVMRRVNLGQLFVALGMLPLENELSSRQLTALAYSVQHRHGPVALTDAFDDRVAGKFPPATTTNDLWRNDLFDQALTVVKVTALREPYRREVLDETRSMLDVDLGRMEELVRRGASFYLTPEGHYSTDGRLRPMRGAIDRLAPLATIYLAGVSYDPFVSKRLSMLYRLVRLDDREHLSQTLAAIRPVVTSQLLARWLETRTDSFTANDASNGVEEQLRALPSSLFVDPELRSNPDRMVRNALPLMLRWGILENAGSSYYRVAAQRQHPEFPHVADIIAFNARFLEETIANAAYGIPYARMQRVEHATTQASLL
jgi:MFS family permease